MKLPNSVEYAHLVKRESEPLPFELRTVPINWRIFPADDIDPVENYQVISLGGTALSDSEADPNQALSQAAYWLMDNSRKEYRKAAERKALDDLGNALVVNGQQFSGKAAQEYLAQMSDNDFWLLLEDLELLA